MDELDEAKYKHKVLWKRRLRNAPSAPSTDLELHLYVLWNPVGRKDRATKTDWKDPLLWSIWALGSGLIFKVVSTLKGGPFNTGSSKYYSDKKEALAEYKRRVKDFPRSKEVDYTFPLDDGPTE